MAFMKKQVVHDLFLVVDTSAGGFSFPADVVGVTTEFSVDAEGASTALLASVGEHVEGKVYSVCSVRGWFARWSAPGYLDATEWSGPFSSEEEAAKHLSDVYEDE